jgi:hypothetical protein
MRHKLHINSLNDAQAECSCLRWSYVRTGAATREEIQREFEKHVPKNQRKYLTIIPTALEAK